jgi:hypothetical protein
MKKQIVILTAAALLAAGAAYAGAGGKFRVHYTLRGAGRTITIVAQSSQEARHVVQAQ